MTLAPSLRALVDFRSFHRTRRNRANVVMQSSVTGCARSALPAESKDHFQLESKLTYKGIRIDSRTNSEDNEARRDPSTPHADSLCESARSAQDDNLLAIQLPDSRVPSEPPISCVVFFWRTASSTAASILSASFVNSRCRSNMAAVRIAPKGFASFFPAIGGAEPWTGSNIDVLPG